MNAFGTDLEGVMKRAEEGPDRFCCGEGFGGRCFRPTLGGRSGSCFGARRSAGRAAGRGAGRGAGAGRGLVAGGRPSCITTAPMRIAGMNRFK